jgi:hypothetical protein
MIYLPLPYNTPELEEPITLKYPFIDTSIRYAYNNMTYQYTEMIREFQENIKNTETPIYLKVEVYNNLIKDISEDFLHIVYSVIQILSRNLTIDYDISTEPFMYQINTCNLINPNLSLHIDLQFNLYYFADEKRNIYDFSENKMTTIEISNIRLVGFDQMISKYANQYNYFVGVYYLNQNRLDDVQIGVTGTLNYYDDGKDIEELYQKKKRGEYNKEELKEYKQYIKDRLIEIPICAAQREIYEETRLFFDIENIKYESQNETDTKYVYSYFVDVKDARFVTENEVTEYFNDISRFEKFNYPQKYYPNRPLKENRGLKVSILLAGNDIRDTLIILNHQINDLNDKIKMVSCLGKNFL